MIKIGDKEYRNLEEQVAFLTQKSNLASLGLHFKGIVSDESELPMENAVDGDTYGVGAQPPYRYFAYNGEAYSDIGTWPLAGPKGVPGDRGPQGPAGPVGPKGDKGNQGIAGPAGGGMGVERITKMDLAVGRPSLAYSNTTGATLVKQGKITAAGQDYSISVNDKLPIIPGKNVSIKPNTANTALEINAEQAVQSVNGKTGAVVLKTSDLQNDSGFITASYHDPEKQNTLVSGDNIKTINNESILGPGNITISGGGTAGVTSLNSKTGAITLAAGNNVTINESGNTLTINATGGGGGSTFTFPAVDLTNATVPGSGTFTDEEANLLRYANNKVSFIIIKDTIGGLDTCIVLPLVYLDSIHDQYTYENTVSGNNYTLKAILQKTTGDVWGIKSYDITKTATGGGGGGTLYQHNIETLCDPATYVYWTGYTSDNEPINSITPWLMKFGYDKVYGGGYVKYNGSYYPILYTQADSEAGVRSYFSIGSSESATYQWGGAGQWTDNVKEV